MLVIRKWRVIISVTQSRPHQLSREIGVAVGVLRRQGLVVVPTSKEVVSVVFCGVSENGSHDLNEMRVLVYKMVAHRPHKFTHAGESSGACTHWDFGPLSARSAIDCAGPEELRAEDGLRGLVGLILEFGWGKCRCDYFAYAVLGLHGAWIKTFRFIHWAVIDDADLAELRVALFCTTVVPHGFEYICRGSAISRGCF
jgi:hypothetical protein